MKLLVRTLRLSLKVIYHSIARVTQANLFHYELQYP